MRTSLCRAIQTATLVAFDYDGKHRIVEPYCHGTAANGQELLRAYQIAGASRSGELGWRLFDVQRITELRGVNEHFFSRAEYDRVDSVIQTVHCCI